MKWWIHIYEMISESTLMYQYQWSTLMNQYWQSTQKNWYQWIYIYALILRSTMLNQYWQSTKSTNGSTSMNWYQSTLMNWNQWIYPDDLLWWIHINASTSVNQYWWMYIWTDIDDLHWWINIDGSTVMHWYQWIYIKVFISTFYLEESKLMGIFDVSMNNHQWIDMDKSVSLNLHRGVNVNETKWWIYINESI